MKNEPHDLPAPRREERLSTEQNRSFFSLTFRESKGKKRAKRIFSRNVSEAVSADCCESKLGECSENSEKIRAIPLHNPPTSAQTLRAPPPLHHPHTAH